MPEHITREDAIARQLRSELGERFGAAGALAGPAWTLEFDHLAGAITDRILPVLLYLEVEDQELAGTVTDLMNVLWPTASPEAVGEERWWHSPLGRICARSLGVDDASSVTQSVAAAMLGVTRGTVAQLVSRGTLARHPDGGVSRAAVLRRLSLLSRADGRR